MSAKWEGRTNFVKMATEFIFTDENFEELLAKREVKDVLIQEKHPFRQMDRSGFTYLDYVLYKTKQRGRPLKKIINELNGIFQSGKHIEYFI